MTWRWRYLTQSNFLSTTSLAWSLSLHLLLCFSQEKPWHTHTHTHTRTHVLNGWPQTNVVELFLCIGSANYIRASPPARKMSIFSSNMNKQNSVVMFAFSDFDCKYHFWVNLLQIIKIISLFWNLVRGLIRICRIQWWCSIFLLFIGITLFRQIWSN